MKPAPFTYHDPTSVAETVGLLSRLDNAKLLSGGQSLMPMLNMRYLQPDHVVDLNGVAGLDGIVIEGERLVLGSMVRQRDLELSHTVRRGCPLMAEALACVGHRPTRNRGTLGGSLAHLDPAAELPLVVLAHEADVHVTGSRERRDLAMVDFPRAYMTPAIDPDEMVVGVSVPLWPKDHGHAFLEFAPRHGDFAIVAVAVLLEIDDGGAIRHASLALGGVGSIPLRASTAAALLAGEQGTDTVFREAARETATVEAFSDVHATAEYRRHLVGVLTRRALAIAYARGRRDDR